MSGGGGGELVVSRSEHQSSIEPAPRWLAVHRYDRVGGLESQAEQADALLGDADQLRGVRALLGAERFARIDERRFETQQRGDVVRLVEGDHADRAQGSRARLE